MQNTKDKKLHIINWCRFVVRTLLFVFFGIVYIVGKINGWQHSFGGLEFNKAIIIPLWLMFAFEIVAKLLPNDTENVGCKKQYKKFFEPTGNTKPKLLPWKKNFACCSCVGFAKPCFWHSLSHRNCGQWLFVYGNFVLCHG